MYNRHSLQSGGWNIFARELQNVLRAYNLSLGQLEERAGIDPEKVRRLAQSLRNSPSKSLPVLNPSEMEQLTHALNLSEDDIIRLDAAIFTSTIQQTLAERLSKPETLHATNQLFEIIHNAFQEEAESTLGLGNSRGGPDTSVSDDSELDDTFTSISIAIDNANRILLSKARMSRAKKEVQLQTAITFLKEALQELDTMPGSARRGPTWNYWRREAQQSLTAAQKLLDTL